MKDHDLERLFAYFDEPSHAFHSVQRYEARNTALGLWPVLSDAHARVTEMLGVTLVASSEATPTGTNRRSDR